MCTVFYHDYEYRKHEYRKHNLFSRYHTVLAQAYEVAHTSKGIVAGSYGVLLHTTTSVVKLYTTMVPNTASARSNGCYSIP